MKELFTFSIGERPQAGLLKDLLENEAISCFIKNEGLAIAQGEIPITECYPEVWILNDEDYAKAADVLSGFQTPQSEGRNSWVCPTCGETIEGQFSDCWKCGKAT